MVERRVKIATSHAETRPRTSTAIVVGFVTVIAFLGGLIAWSDLAPLESAAMAPGFVSVETHHKTIKHLEGGIVESILVQEGHKVSPGQTLIVLDPTRARAKLDALKGRQLSLTAREVRLIAEETGRKRIVFPTEFGAKLADAKLMEILEGEIMIFRTHKQTLASQISVLKQQNAQYSELIAGLKKSVAAQSRQLQITREEIDLYQFLLEKGLTQKPRVLQLQRTEAEIEGRRSQNEAEIARANQRMGETILRIHDARAERKNKAAEELRSVQTELFELESQITAAEDLLNRTVIKAPIDGTVVALRMHTPGGVIKPGDPLLDIVPRDDRLLVDARINPDDIDVVHPGLLARVYLTAFHKRHVRALEGEVLSVSADRLVEDRSGEAYYLARIELTESPGDVLDGALLYPGMGAEVMIITGTRTALEYLFEPITRSFNFAFRES